jgi:lambda family phage tail tape measure protein
MWDLARQSPTMWDTGIEMAKRMRQAFDDLGGAIADLLTKGTFDFRQFANSIINDLIRMMVQATITRPLFNWISGFIGLPAGGGPSAWSSSGTQLFGGNASLSAVPKMHSGGVAPDEMLAILQRGETVLPEKLSGRLGGNVNTTIQVNVTAPQGGNVSSADSHRLGSEIATVVKAEFDKNLQRHLQPGGMLNRGMGF